MHIVVHKLCETPGIPRGIPGAYLSLALESNTVTAGSSIHRIRLSDLMQIEGPLQRTGEWPEQT